MKIVKKMILFAIELSLLSLLSIIKI